MLKFPMPSTHEKAEQLEPFPGRKPIIHKAERPFFLTPKSVSQLKIRSQVPVIQKPI